MEVSEIVGMFKKNKIRLVADDIIILTPRGKEAAEQDCFSGKRAQILMALNDRGATSIRELANDTRMPISAVKDTAEDLMKRAQVRKVGYEG